MRLIDLWESSEPVVIKATKRFKKDYQDFSRRWSSFDTVFEEFVRSKIANPREPFGQKDKAGTGPLRGWNHVHIIYGKAIVSYRIQGSTILLAAVTDHLSVEGTGIRLRALAEYLDSLDLSKFGSFDVSDDDQSTDHSHKATVMELWYEMAAHPVDRQVLVQFVNGVNQDALEFLAVLDPPLAVKDVDKFTLRSWATQALDQTAPG
jgi:mRNA-degrading endonuclease YafQ of YafQ-DinJ toxin-antitoxin module